MLSMIVSVVSLTGTANRRLVLPLGFRIYQYAIKLEIGHNLLITNYINQLHVRTFFQMKKIFPYKVKEMSGNVYKSTDIILKNQNINKSNNFF